MAGPTTLSHDEMLAALHGLRLPAEAAGGVLAELAVALGLGLALAGCVALLLAQVTRPRPAPATDLAARIAALRGMPEEARTLALLHLLRETRPRDCDALRGQLYRPGGCPGAEMLEALLLRKRARDA